MAKNANVFVAIESDSIAAANNTMHGKKKRINILFRTPPIRYLINLYKKLICINL